MIIDREGSHFIFIVAVDHLYKDYNYINYKGKELTNKEYLKYWGKWIILESRDKMDELSKKLDPFVENKSIPAIKYDRKPIPEFQLEKCVMCVYCDVRQREEVWRILESVGVGDKAWVFEKETVEKWLPGGYLLEKWIKSKGFNPEKAEKVRKSSREKFRKMFEDEHAFFKGIDQ